ncbi:hypothetical protein POK33_29500 [Burkholderia cenocepacia]|uniref:hypothetical protein n=1 Tax=Burkholderia cenocepacia TaxID=95486 RepID=UPI0023B9CAC6|nr:hypothetical protein [Burkholderia cenocepacia]MDF0504875.1 hypothetical protein [Burkholderia cenocepacia]
MKDMKGDEFVDGCQFLKPVTFGRSALVGVLVARIRNGRLYGDTEKDQSNVPIAYPQRCYILEAK